MKAIGDRHLSRHRYFKEENWKAPAMVSIAALAAQAWDASHARSLVIQCNPRSMRLAAMPKASQTSRYPTIRSTCNVARSWRAVVIRSNLRISGKAVGSIIAAVIRTQPLAYIAAGANQ